MYISSSYSMMKLDFYVMDYNDVCCMMSCWYYDDTMLLQWWYDDVLMIPCIYDVCDDIMMVTWMNDAFWLAVVMFYYVVVYHAFMAYVRTLVQWC